MIIYGQPQAGIDSAKTIFNKYTKKEIVTHCADYTGWRNNVLRQLRFKYKPIEHPTDVYLIFNLKESEPRTRLKLYTDEIIDILIESKVLKDRLSILPFITLGTPSECPNVEIDIQLRKKYK